MILIGSFYILTTFLGFGAATLVGQGEHRRDERRATWCRTRTWRRRCWRAKSAARCSCRSSSAIAFATILAVVAGLTIAASSAFAHDIWFTVVKRQQEDEREQVLVARVTAAVIGLLSIGLAIALRSLNVAFLVGLAFAVAASANVPAILLTLYWRRFNTTRHDCRHAGRAASRRSC